MIAEADVVHLLEHMHLGLQERLDCPQGHASRVPASHPGICLLQAFGSYPLLDGSQTKESMLQGAQPHPWHKPSTCTAWMAATQDVSTAPTPSPDPLACGGLQRRPTPEAAELRSLPGGVTCCGPRTAPCTHRASAPGPAPHGTHAPAWWQRHQRLQDCRLSTSPGQVCRSWGPPIGPWSRPTLCGTWSASLLFRGQPPHWIRLAVFL